MHGLADILDPARWSLRLEHLSIPAALLLFLSLAAVVLVTGRRHLTWVTPTRRAVAIGVRLALIWVLVMVLGGLKWWRTHEDVEVVVVRDISASVASTPVPAGSTVGHEVDTMLAATRDAKRPGDRIGVVRLGRVATIDLPPSHEWAPRGTAIAAVESDGTDIAAGIRLGLASFGGDAMRRLVLISDGNPTQGSVDDAVAAATAARVGVDVIPLKYSVEREVMLERLIAPTSVRAGEPFSVESILRSTCPHAVRAKLTLTRRGMPVDMDDAAPGVQASLGVTLRPGATPVRVKLPPSPGGGLCTFHATLEAEDAAHDTLVGNNAADAFTFITGGNKVLYVDNVGGPEGARLAEALTRGHGSASQVDRVAPDEFPDRLIDLQAYDAVILANVPRGTGGLDETRLRLLCRYVHDLGGGLLVVGGPDALGAGNWRGSELEAVLPVRLDVPPERVLPPGALVVVLDRSGSMNDPMPGSGGGAPQSKQRVANDAAAMALRSLQADDLVGVIAFDAGVQWAVPLGRNASPEAVDRTVRSIGNGSGTNIGPALAAAVAALARLDRRQASAKRVLLLTDGVSQPHDYARVLADARAGDVAVSTVAIGLDADRDLLHDIASEGGGEAHVARDAQQLTDIFVREARTLRRSLIHEPRGGVEVVANPVFASEPLLGSLANTVFPPLNGIVLTAARPDPMAAVPLRTTGAHRDPVLAYWQTGLGRCAVFTGDATSRWAPEWVGSPVFAAFWSQLVRSVSRPAAGRKFDVRTVRDGPRTKFVVEAADPNGTPLNFFNFVGRLTGPDARTAAEEIRLSQTGPGRYEATVNTPNPGTYVGVIQYAGPAGVRGTLVAGASVTESPELRDLASNEQMLAEIAARTGGRVLPGIPYLRAAAADFFDREGLAPSSSPMPLWDVLIACALGLVVIDVGCRRIAWDWAAIRGWGQSAVGAVLAFTTTRRIEPSRTLDGLLVARDQTLADRDQRVRPMADVAAAAPRVTVAPQGFPPTLRDDRPLIPADRPGNLWEAKRRARQRIEELEQQESQARIQSDD